MPLICDGHDWILSSSGCLHSTTLYKSFADCCWTAQHVEGHQGQKSRHARQPTGRNLWQAYPNHFHSAVHFLAFLVLGQSHSLSSAHDTSNFCPVASKREEEGEGFLHKLDSTSFASS